MKNRKIHKIVVDRNLCTGLAPCIAVAPKAFELDDEYKAVVKKGWEDLDDDVLLIAAQSCPVMAIILYDKQGKQIFPQ
ncbi:ferredoxin [candidate division WWE3 bacterium CG10_big_fil_rev_8_21_14_0_10_32_10]|uniref:Ferredoxin n=1 Tax=candidate division WWE3 bacterium CG10_big_fil_rev_8_21_14_0_10_32_10 TaxID=1975090 RepID=A0A2H0R9Z3_UNCKA|nr:MAG: ferredoxin [candidate division WWE3 bacterium CG10_big_fil_rev_8_21_14_0_10_32_10]